MLPLFKNQNSLNLSGNESRWNTVRWIARAPVAGIVVGLVGFAATGCAAEPYPAGSVEARVADGISRPSIFGGAEDDDAASLSGVVALRVGTGNRFGLCSGALVAPNVVLTARHCLTNKSSTSVTCDEEGRSLSGDHVISNVDPASVGIYLGASPDFDSSPSARGAQIVAPSGANLCDSDIALLVLDKAIEGVAPLPLRMSSPVQAGETIRSAGYGQNDKSALLGTRFRKDGVSVLAQGKAVSASKTPLGSHEFEVGLSTCRGDSGGPAISETSGAVIGVVSRGGHCDEDFGHIYTTTSGFEELFDRAFATAKTAPKREAGDVEAQQLRIRSAADEAMVEGEANAGCSIKARGDVGTGGAAGASAVGLALAVVVVSRARRRR